MAANIEWVDVDRDLVALQVAEADAVRRRPLRWLARTLGITAVLMLGLPLLIVLPKSGGSDLLSFLQQEASRKLIPLIGVAAVLVVSQAWSVWSRAARDVDVRVRSVQRSWRRLTGPNWPAWTILLGVGMALGIGVPVGTLIALDRPLSELGPGGRLEAVVMFVVLTAAWTLPAAFLVRWPSIKQLRKLVRTPD